jgi:hypothetical protein
MDCRRFRKQHAQFLDDLLPGVDTWAMRDHLRGCSACSQIDTQLRRAIMLARNAPVLAPSPEFQQKLAARLATERRALRLVQPAAPRWTVRVAAAAAVLVAVIGGRTIAVRSAAGDQMLALAPIVVMPPALPAEPVAAPAMFATVSSSLPVFPAMLLAQRATEQFVATRARAVTFQATH